MAVYFWRMVWEGLLAVAADAETLVDFRRAVLSIAKSDTPEEFRAGLLQFARMLERRYNFDK